jgi:hypothetical protein
MNLRAEDLRWQTGTSRWSRIRTLIITDDVGLSSRLAGRRDTVVVATPLELVFALEAGASLISTIVLGGRFERDHDLTAFLHDHYPQVGLGRLGVETN